MKFAYRAIALVGLLVSGCAAVGWLVEEAGTAAVADAMRNASGAIAAAFLIEGFRILCEAGGTVALLQRGTREGRPIVPLLELLRVHLVVYALGMALPAGRAAAETYKAVALSPHVGGGPATAVGTSSQGLTLVANAVVSVPAAITAAWVLGFGLLTAALCLHAVISLVSGVGVLLLARSQRLARWLMRFPLLREPVRAFTEVQSGASLFPPRAALLIIAARALQVVQFGVLAAGVGLGSDIASGPALAMLAHGVQAVGSMAGDLIPGQVGVTEGAFRLAASTFGSLEAVAISVALLAHSVQLAWILIGSLLPLLWRNGKRTAPSQATPS